MSWLANVMLVYLKFFFAPSSVQSCADTHSLLTESFDAPTTLSGLLSSIAGYALLTRERAENPRNKCEEKYAAPTASLHQYYHSIESCAYQIKGMSAFRSDGYSGNFWRYHACVMRARGTNVEMANIHQSSPAHVHVASAHPPHCTSSPK